MRKLVFFFISAAAFGPLTGCGPDRPITVSDETIARQQLRGVYDLIQFGTEHAKRAPQKPADLRAGETAYPEAYEAVRSGEVVVLWGTAPADGANDLLAYQKTVPEAGGWVLSRGGVVKKISADEFKSLAKAGQ